MGAFFLRHGGLVNNVIADLVNNVTPQPLGARVSILINPGVAG